MDTGSKWVLAQFVMLLAIGLAVAFFGGSPRLPSTIGAVVLFLAGQVMALAAAFKMRQYLTAHPAPVPGASMLRDGVYGLVRHPMYGGVILMAAAVAVFDVNWLALGLTVALAGVFYAKSSYEEALLRGVFLGYADYQKQVKRRFIPWVL